MEKDKLRNAGLGFTKRLRTQPDYFVKQGNPRSATPLRDHWASDCFTVGKTGKALDEMTLDEIRNLRMRKKIF